MKQLTAVTWDDDRAHRCAALGQRPRSALVRQNLGMLIARFRDYRGNASCPENITASQIPAGELKNALISLFENPPASLLPLKEAVRDLERRYCCYCGGIDTPGAVDHILEKTLFPEYSMFSLNLVPICDKCNLSKKPRIVNGLRRCINPYIDTFLSRITVTCKVDIVDHVPGFELHVEGRTLRKSELDLIEAHLDTFGIRGKFSLFAAAEFGDYQVHCCGMAYSRNEIVAWVRDQLALAEQRDGVNSWRAALLRGLRSTPSTVPLLSALRS